VSDLGQNAVALPLSACSLYKRLYGRPDWLAMTEMASTNASNAIESWWRPTHHTCYQWPITLVDDQVLLAKEVASTMINQNDLIFGVYHQCR
jgi:hypothetical protein